MKTPNAKNLTKTAEPIEFADAQHAAHNLELFADNTRELYDRKKAVIRSLLGKLKKGVYEAELAKKLWRGWIDAAALMYEKELGEKGDARRVFTDAIRKTVVDEFERSEKYAMEQGDWDYLLDKKATTRQASLSRQEAYQLMASPLQDARALLIVGTGAGGNDAFDNVAYDLRAGDVPLDFLVRYLRQPGHGGMPELTKEDLTAGSFVESQTKTLTKVLVGYAIGDGRSIDVELQLRKPKQAAGLGLSESAIATHLDVMQDMLAKGDAQGLKKRLDQLAADIRRIANASTKYANELRNPKGKNFMLRFLPYLETPDGQKVETIIGYPNPSRGYGWGRWEEFFSTVNEARDRMRFLIAAGVVEDIELRQATGSGMGSILIDSWDEKEGKEASTRQAVRSATDRVSTDGYHYVLEVGGDVDDPEAWEIEMGEVSGQYRGDVMVDGSRCILFHDDETGSDYAVLPQNATINGKEAATKLAATDLRSLAIELYKNVVGKAGKEVAQMIQEAIKKAYELGAAEKAARVAALLKTAAPDADDLVLYIDNKEKLYAQKKSIVKNVMRRLKNGTYDADKAVKLWAYLVEAGAKMWAQELGDEDGDRSVKWNVLFPTAVREQAARDMSETAKQEIEDGTWDFLNEKEAKTAAQLDPRSAVVYFDLHCEEENIKEDAGDPESPDHELAKKILADKTGTILLDLEADALAQLKKTLGTSIGNEGHDKFDNLVCKITSVSTVEDVTKLFDKLHVIGGDDIVDTGVPYFSAQGFTLFPEGVNGPQVPYSDFDDWKEENKEAATKTAAGSALPDPSGLSGDQLGRIVKSVQVVAFDPDMREGLALGVIRKLLTRAGLGTIVEAARSASAPRVAASWKALDDKLGKRWILDAKDSDVFDAFHVKETKGPGIPLYSLQAILKDGTTLRYRALKDLKEAQKVAETYLKSDKEGASLLLTDGWTRT